MGEGASYWALGGIALADEQPGQAATWLHRALEVFVRTGHAASIQVTLRWTTAAAKAAGHAETSAVPARRSGRGPR